MNYPIWESTFFGGGTWIALISILHVYISHLAVGGGFFLWLTDRKAWRENGPEWHEYVRKHTWFFLYLTMVFGGVTGVGIWFVIALVNPAATSLLIHNFVFGWAIEWVFFVGEIAALLLYAYRFDKLDRHGRQVLMFFYALFAWLSLFIINGILSFMLTPGRWLETRWFWDGFLNPGFLWSLLFRTAMALMIAGVFGYITALFVKDPAFRTRLMRYCSRWLLLPMPVAAATAYAYWLSTPGSIRLTAFGQNPSTAVFVMVFMVGSGGLLLGGMLLALRSGRFVQSVLAGLVVITGLGWLGGFEYIREIARKPYVISGVMYANSIALADQKRIETDGVLATARWSAIKTITDTNTAAAGRELFNLQCLSCHTIGGVRNDILSRTAQLTYSGILAQLTGQGRLLRYMPPVLGTMAEKRALAAYLAQLGGKAVQPEPESHELPSLETSVPKKVVPSNKEDDSYVLFAWNDQGMPFISDCDRWFSLLPLGNNLEAQVIKCGLLPELQGTNVEISFRVEAGFENPAGQVAFWDYRPQSAPLQKNIGLSGNGTSGKFVYEPKTKSFRADQIPVVPYTADNRYNPFPLFTVEAHDRKSGRLLASTQVAAPVSTEMGCRNCHGGGWRTKNGAGISDETAQNILKAHDRINQTSLYADALAGKPAACASCHADPSQNAPGKPGVLNLSAAMHGWHANYMYAEGAQACGLCHPTLPTGMTRAFRGVHSALGLSCVKCHGSISDHALTLLKRAGTPAASALMKNLAATAVASSDEIVERNPWINKPDCLNCHDKFEMPQKGFTGFNRWTAEAKDLYRNRSDDAGIRCTACHGSTHAEYPAFNKYHPLRDVLQPMQNAGKPFPIGAEKSCEVCHLEKMENPASHHPNMDRPFRNATLKRKAEALAPATRLESLLQSKP